MKKTGIVELKDNFKENFSQKSQRVKILGNDYTLSNNALDMKDIGK